MKNQFTPFADYIKTQAASETGSGKSGFQLQFYHKGDTIFSQGDRGYAAYVIKTGGVEISIRDDKGKHVLTALGEQSVFGELALLTGRHTRSATATATEESEIIRIPKKVFDQYLKDSPKVISACLVAIAHRLNAVSTSREGRTATLERIARILNLFQHHKKNRLDYPETVSTLARSLDKEEEDIREYLGTMEDFNLIDLDPSPENAQTLVLMGGKRFIEKSLKVFSMIDGYEQV